MRLYTISNGYIEPGTRVGRTFTTQGATPTITVGHDTPFCKSERLTVILSGHQYSAWKITGSLWASKARIQSLRRTDEGVFCQISQQDEESDGFALCILRTIITGPTSLTGPCEDTHCQFFGNTEIHSDSNKCPLCGTIMDSNDCQRSFQHPYKGDVKIISEFPGEIICSGDVSYGPYGPSGAAGISQQQIVLIPAHTVFQVYYGGWPQSYFPGHTYTWDGKNMTVKSLDEDQYYRRCGDYQ